MTSPKRNQAVSARAERPSRDRSAGSRRPPTSGPNVRPMGGDSSDIAVFLVVLAMRFVIPLFIPRFPLPAILAALVIDAADQTIFQQWTNLNLDGYQNYDKALDIFYLTIAFLAVYRNWTNTTRDQRRPLPLVLPALRRLAVRGLPGTMDPVRLPEHVRVLLHRLRRDPNPVGPAPPHPPSGHRAGRVHLDLHQAAPGMVDPHRPERLHRLHEGRRLRHDPDHLVEPTRSPTGRQSPSHCSPRSGCWPVSPCGLTAWRRRRTGRSGSTSTSRSPRRPPRTPAGSALDRSAVRREVAARRVARGDLHERARTSRHDLPDRRSPRC